MKPSKHAINHHQSNPPWLNLQTHQRGSAAISGDAARGRFAFHCRGACDRQRSNALALQGSRDGLKKPWLFSTHQQKPGRKTVWYHKSIICYDLWFESHFFEIA